MKEDYRQKSEFETSAGKQAAAGGFLFYSGQDAELAETEQKKIEYLEARMDYKNPDKILQIYEKALEDRIFTTPVGLFYLKQVQSFLLEQPEIDEKEVSPIPVFTTFKNSLRASSQPAKRRVKPPMEKKKLSGPSPVHLSLILNILLMLAVIAMFAITLESDNPNVLNYERALTNRYASWEQELTDREQKVREEERRLKIELEEDPSQF